MTKRMLLALLLSLPAFSSAGEVKIDPFPPCLPCSPVPEPPPDGGLQPRT